MKGDFTRWNFKSGKHYHAVLKQQGRVDLDADWNEQDAIASHRVETETVDVVGPCGAPVANPGFTLSAANNGATLSISKGRAYVDGLLCENEQDLLVTAQPDLPDFKLPTAPGVYIAFLEVWLRHLTALDDAGIREPALGGPDTCTRNKTVWQVGFLQAPATGANINCSTRVAAWDALTAPSTGTLMAQAVPDSGSTDPCIIPNQAGYRRLENQLYRVEIHAPGGANATFKWSRDNGSVVVAWTAQNGNDLTVSSTGPDSVLGFAPGQWVELVDDTHELTFTPGTLVQLANVQGQTLTINPATATGSVNFADFSRTPKVRRWDSAGLVPLTTGSWLDLEDGVQVQFGAGTFANGDYWLIPARTLTANVDWPLDTSNQPLPESPRGIRRHFCKLAIVQFDGTSWSIVTPCLPSFPPLTQITAGQDKGIHVTGVQLAPNTDLPNDSDVVINAVLERFAIIIACDAPIDPVSAQPTTCFVSVDLPYPLGNTFTGNAAQIGFLGFQRLILPGIVRVSGNSIIWQMGQRDTMILLRDILNFLVQQQGTSRLLTRLTLKGNVIWGLHDPTTFLDGEAYGITRTDPDGSTHIGLRLPASGNGRKGGDFEMWFWLVLPVRPASLGFNPSPVDAGQNSTGTVTLNGPAPANGAVVTLSAVALDASGAQLPGVTLAALPPNVTVPAGQVSANFPVTQTTVPATGLTATLQVTASFGGNSVQGNLTITRPLGPTGLSFSPPGFLGGTAVTGSLTLSGPAPANGAVVVLTSNNATLARLPGSVTVPAGQTAVNFQFTTAGLPLNAPPVVVIAVATFNGKSVQGTFTIIAPRLA